MIHGQKILGAALTTIALLSGVRTHGAPEGERPNIVIIVADDMGYSDPGCYGGEIATPNLDKLAAGGLRFTQFYNTARCWPSRACIMTGYYAQEVRRDAMPGLKGGGQGIRPAWANLLPEMLKPLGYRSYHSGKWHVDGPVLAGGFEHSYSLNDHDRYFYPRHHTLDDKPLPPVATNEGYYASTAIAEHAIDFLAGHQKEHAKDPFFLYLAFISPHFPLHAKPEDIALYRDRYTNGWDALRSERFERQKQLGIVNTTLSPLDSGIIPNWNLSEEKLRAAIGDGEIGHALPWAQLTDEQKKFQPVKMSIHAAMVHRMDIEIGRVINQLKSMNALDNTAIFFVSDNGASAEQIIRGDQHDKNAPPGSGPTFLSLGPGWSSAANTPHRLHKSWVHEGGISTPLIACWPKGIAAHGELRTTPGHLIDLVPTVLDIAGGSWAVSNAPPRPGRSLVPAFAKDGTVAHDFFWWCHDSNRAIRAGDWKLVADHQKPWELYDLKTDRAESHDLAEKFPDKVKELSELWEKHAAEYRAEATKDAPPEPVTKPRRPKGASATPAES